MLDYLGKPNRKMCSLYLSMLDKWMTELTGSGIRRSGWRRCAGLLRRRAGRAKRADGPGPRLGLDSPRTAQRNHRSVMPNCRGGGRFAVILACAQTRRTRQTALP